LVNKEKYLLVLVGPTAIGKTTTAIALSQSFNGVIVSADSRQIYKELKIGTAKPSPSEISNGNIKLVDYVSIQDSYSAAVYEEDALQCIDNAYLNGYTPILSGGTGLYIKAVCEGLDNIPKVPLEITQSIEDQLEVNRVAVLEELEKADPISFARVDKANDRRLIRMLGVIRFTNKAFSSFINQPKTARIYTPFCINLERPREELYTRINKRVQYMIEAGLVDEVTSLLPHRQKRALDTVGYSEVFKYIDGEYDLDRTIELIQQNTRRYAKRQMTWFRNQMNTLSFHPDDISGLTKKIQSILKL